jgi:flavin reductase (DIM6/NTAB) family NADH-FMN oxidoreductase RutF
MSNDKSNTPTPDSVVDLQQFKQSFKQALGRFASGVTVVGILEGETMRGMTASAFISVSLEPPLVLVSVAKTARMHQALQTASHYGISILAEGQREISDHFAWKSLEEAPLYHATAGVALLEGALSHLACRIVDRHDAGDHTLMVGHVEYVENFDHAPLLYYKGKYGQFLELEKPNPQ